MVDHQLPRGLRLHRKLKVQMGNVHEIAWSPDGRYLASGNPDGQVLIWDAETGTLQSRLDRGDRLVWSIAWSPDGKRLASGSHQGVVGIWDTGSGERLRILERHESWVRSVTWSPDGKRLATGSNDRSLAIWSTESGERLNVLEGHQDRVLSARWSPDGNRLASASGDGTLIVWNASSGEHIYRLQIQSGWLRSLAWTPDGRYLSCGAEDGVLRLWHADDGKPAAVLDDQSESIGCTSFDASGRILASRSVDGRVRLWSASRGAWQSIASFKETGTFPMQNLTFHPKTPFLATASQSSIHVWEVDLETLLAATDGRSDAPLRTAKVVCLGQPADQVEEITRSLTGSASALERGRGIYLHSSRETDSSEGPGRREILVWDLVEHAKEHPWQQVAGLRDATLAIVAFDPQSAEDPTPAVRSAVENIRRVSDAAVLLVATDEAIGGPHRTAIHTMIHELAPDDYLSISSLSSRDIGQLEVRMLHWVNRLPLTVLDSEIWLEEVETFLLQELRAGRQVATTDDLFRTFATRFQSTTSEQERREPFEGCLRQLELRGHHRRLKLGNLSISPALFGTYAKALAAAAMADPDGLGILSEQDATNGPLALTEPEQPADSSTDRLLRMAVIEELIELGLMLREPSERGNLLLMPGLLGKSRKAMALPETGEPIQFKIRGPVENLFLSILAKLARGSLFAAKEVFSDGAGFSARFGGHCGIRITLEHSQSALLTLSFSNDTSEETRLLFEEIVSEHLNRHLDADSLERYRVFACPGCTTPLSELQVQRICERGIDRTSCPVCDTLILIRDGRDRLKS